ncbi:hypothetical protein V9K67_12495 [Paraflavisolibacter sp. H34]|uniref:LolA family protein n=1 Tax=Huijunlia imazamoxiresistens TaxID=3127457 RepID=UPI0030193B0A
MKRLIALVSFFLFTAVPLFAQADLLKAVKAKLDKVADYTATGKMNVDVSYIRVPEAPVTVYYKRPDKFAIRKADGLSILPKGGASINVSTLLSGSNYSAVPAGKAVVGGLPVTVVKLLPLDENSDVVLTTLYIDEKALLVRKAAVTTRDHGSYEIEMEYGKFSSWGLPDKVAFVFNTSEYKLPKGITFEYEKGDKKPAPAAKNKKGKVEIFYSNYTINKGVSDAVFKKA